MLHTDKAIIVEGRYDKIKLSNVTDALILTTDGFGIFNDKEKQLLIKKTAAEKGLLIITDSDAAGFKIRNFLKNIARSADVSHIYIPDVFGKEKRKAEASKEGKLGVEGIDNDLLINALIRSGEFEKSEKTNAGRKITTADLFEAGLSGTPGCTEKRRRLLAEMGLPARLTGASFLSVLNTFMTYDDFVEKTETLSD